MAQPDSLVRQRRPDDLHRVRSAHQNVDREHHMRPLAAAAPPPPRPHPHHRVQPAQQTRSSPRPRGQHPSTHRTDQLARPKPPFDRSQIGLYRQHRRLRAPRGPPGSGVQTKTREGRTQPDVLTVPSQTKTDNPRKGRPPQSSPSTPEPAAYILILSGAEHRGGQAESLGQGADPPETSGYDHGPLR